MSGQWEVVGKGKKSGNGTVKQKLTKTEKKKFIENAPRIEDILPLAQVKTLYNALDKESKKPRGTSEKDNKTKENESRKQNPPKKPVSDKPKEAPKPPKPKSIESALSAIDVSEIKLLLETCQARFSDAPLILLKELTQYLNNKLSVDVPDPTFGSRPVDYPLNVVPTPLRQLLIKVVKDAGKPTAQLFYDICLTSIANDMSKGSMALGYKIFAQLMAFEEPTLCIGSLAKSALLRNSYQNRAPIGLSILWALGKGGVKDLSVGLKVWQEIMVPVLEMKHYSRFVVGYLSGILSLKHEATTTLSNELFLQLLDTVNTPKSGFNKELSNELLAQADKIRDVMFNNDKNLRLNQLFPQLLKRLHGNQCEGVQREAARCLVQALYVDPQCFNNWRQNYAKMLPQSVVLLEYINRNWKDCSQKLGIKKLKELVSTFEATNEELAINRKKDDGLQDSVRVCKILADKMKTTKSSPWGTGCFVILGLAGILFTYDVTTHGGFPKSITGKYLKETGALEAGQQICERALGHAARGYKWSEANVPQYYNKGLYYVRPYLDLAYDTTIFTKKAGTEIFLTWANYVDEKLIEYFPTFVKDIETGAKVVWNKVSTVSVEYINIGCDYLKTQVFTGQLSPENLQKVTLDVLNKTQDYASKYYSWFYEKVDTYSKVQ